MTSTLATQLTKPKWKLYYSDGSTRSWLVGPPVEMKDHFGIQAILQERGDKRHHILSGHDFYILDKSGYWIPTDRDSIYERFMFHRKEIKSVVRGFAIPFPEFNDIYARAKQDKDAENLD